MKKYLLLSLLIVPFLWANVSKEEYPNIIAQARLSKQLVLFSESIEHFKQTIETSIVRDQWLQAYKECRAAYKHVETYVMYRLPDVDKAINGGPVPSMTVDVVLLHKDDPTGLQVIEELMAENNVDKKAILKNLDFIQTKVNILEKSFKAFPLQNWEILDAAHMAITKIITLSLSGFDSPVLLLSISDSKIVLEELKADLASFEHLIGKEYSFQTLEEQLNNAIQYLENQPDFESLDRYDYFRNYLIPLQKNIKTLHRSTGYETYTEVSNNKRAISHGDHLFAADYLDPMYSMRGNLTAHNETQIALGKLLFFDPILSSNNKRSCASCHKADKAFADELAKSPAMDFKGTLKRNTPTLINSCFQSNFFWDLRSKDMNDQIIDVINSAEEFHTSQEAIVKKLQSSDEYQTLFKQAFFAHQQPISPATIKTSLELYIRSLVALDSKFDRNIRAEENSMNESEILGANLFFGKAACATCHFPPNFNGFVPPHYQDTEGEILGTTKTNTFQELDTDYGMFEGFRSRYPEATYIKGMFKTPTIRNVEYTAPYMHHGMYSLEEVVDFYNNGGGIGHGIDVPQQTLASDSLGLSEKEQAALIDFMKTLSDTSGMHVQAFALPKFNDPELDQRVWGGEY